MSVNVAILSERLYVCGIFFFQAEDGIRDDLVTGVQTCALPIWRSFIFKVLANSFEAGGCYSLCRFSLLRRLRGERFLPIDLKSLVTELQEAYLHVH